MEASPAGHNQPRSEWQKMRIPTDPSKQRHRRKGPKRPNPLLSQPIQQQQTVSPLVDYEEQSPQIQHTPLLDSESPRGYQGPSALYKHQYPQEDTGPLITPFYEREPAKTIVRPSPLEMQQYYHSEESTRLNQSGSGRSNRPGYGNYGKRSPSSKYGSIQHVDPYMGVQSDDDEDTSRTTTSRKYSTKRAEKELKNALKQGTLKEQADCRLETMTRVPTTLVLLAPYICFAIALWLDTNWGLQKASLVLSGTDCGASSGSCITESSDGYTWTGQISNVPAASRFLYFDTLFPNDRTLLNSATSILTQSGKQQYQVPCSIELTATNHDGNEIVLFKQSQTVQFWCTNGESSCDAARLVSLTLNSVGDSGWYTNFQISVTYEDSHSELFGDSTFTALFSSKIFMLICKYTRTAVLGLVLFTIFNWLIQNGMEKEVANIWIPDRQYFTALLISLFLWANPVFCYVEWTEGNTADLQSWLLISDLVHAVGTQGLFLSALFLMDGLRFLNKNKSDVVTYTEALADNDLPKHHPCSDYACDFFWIKLVYFVFSMGVDVSCALSRHADVLFRMSKASISFSSQKVEYISGVYLGLSFLSLVFLSGWIFWILKATVRTGLVLKGQPFLINRFQHLMYRILSMQYFLIAVCLCVSFGWEIFYAVQYTLENFNVQLLSQIWTGQTSIEVLWESTPGQLIFMVASFVTIQYIMLPPDHNVKRANNRMYIAMEKDLPPTHLLQRKRPTFCLETALFQLELSWQVYYEVESYGTHFMAVGRVDLSRLGLQIEAVFKDDEHDIRGFLARGENQLILAFRGTMTLKNVLTDLNLGQVLLYDYLDPPENVSHVDWGATSTDSESDIESPRPGGKKLKKKGGCMQGIRRLANAIPCLRNTVPRVHVGFATAYKNIRTHVLKAVKTAQMKEYAPLYVTGHSLGACIGALAAYDIATQAEFPENIVFYSFGMPRLGNARFAKMFNKKVPHHFRLTVDGDAIPGQPHFFYKHCGTRVLVDADYAGSIIINPSIVEKTFGTRGHTNLTCHSLSKYRDCLEACFEKEELQQYLSKGVKTSTGKADPDAVPDWLKEPRKPQDEGCLIS